MEKDMSLRASKQAKLCKENPTAQTSLSKDELEKYKRLSNEGVIPQPRRSLCANESCPGKGHVLDTELSAGEHKDGATHMRMECVYCNTALCRRCR